MAYTTINKSTDHFNTKLYTGTGSSQVLTGIGFSPDLIWTATRNESEIKPMNDSVNGINNYIRSNANDTLETTGSNITAQSSDGYTVGTEDRFNQNSNTFCSWNWKANGQGSSNTDGSINTTYTSANTTSGFSIIKYAGTGNSGTIGHGLSATPKVCFFKEIDGLESWRVWHRAAPNYSTKALKLNGNDAEFSQTNWVGTVDNSIITIGSDSSINTSGNNYICYAFAEKTGYSKFGSYTGNGNADGTFIYTGFKPAWVMVKRTDSTNNWMIIDNKRTPSNTGTVPEIFADSNSAENNSTDGRFDYLSNGLKARGTNAVINASGGTYLYMAFAEAPLVGQNNVPATAR